MRIAILTIPLLLALVACGQYGPRVDAETDGAVTAAAETPAAVRPLVEASADLELVADPSRPAPFDRILLPPGFTIEYFASDVPGARSMAWSENRTLFVGQRQKHDGRVFAVVDHNGDNKAEEVLTIASGLDMPNGVALRDGDLYVAENSRILRFPDIEANLRNPPQPQVINSEYPTDEAHGWKYIAFGPDGHLYVPVGAPCNVCDPDNPIYSTITRIDPDGSNLEIYAKGIRNTVGFDWHPETGELWFTDNGRDWMGDNRPPDELNRAPQQGLDFGFPHVHGHNILDPDFGPGHSAGEFTAPVQELGPHVAALGMKFYTGGMFPEAYRNQIFIAEHGSWNRDEPIGYRVMLVRLDEQGNSLGYDVFATGWRHEGNVWGRPVDVLVMPDGALLVSDDKAGAIYRISHTDAGGG